MPKTIVPEQATLDSNLRGLDEHRREWEETLRAARIQPPTRYRILPVDDAPPVTPRPELIALMLRVLSWRR